MLTYSKKKLSVLNLNPKSINLSWYLMNCMQYTLLFLLNLYTIFFLWYSFSTTIAPCYPVWSRIQLSMQCLQVLTRDSVTVSVDAVVYYRVSNATVSVANVENAHHSTRLLAQTTLRNILGTKNLHEILSDRESISGSMQVI